MLKRTHRGERGFTLVELLVVLGILAILVAIVVPNLTGLLTTTTTTAMGQELEVVRNAIDTYNTKDVAIDGEDDIPASLTWYKIEPNGLSPHYFSDWLHRATKYCYSWQPEGESLTVEDCADVSHK